MSLPTQIRFYDEKFKSIAQEFYNAGWWVPDTVGKDIADLYEEEQDWVTVQAYRKLYNRAGYPIGEFDNDQNLTMYSGEKLSSLKEQIDNPKVREKIKDLPNSVKMPIIRKSVTPSLIADELVGVQPMSEDVGKVFSLKVVKGSGEPSKLKFTNKL